MQDFRQALHAKPRTAEGFLHLILCEQPTRVVPSHWPYSLLDALQRLATLLHRLGRHKRVDGLPSAVGLRNGTRVQV